MALDRLIALIILVIALIYGFAAYHYPLLPFERNLPVLPNTLPKGLSVIAVLIAGFILLAPRNTSTRVDDPDQDTSALQILPAAGLVVAMVLYALLLRPIGFVTATIAFIVFTAAGLGERRWRLLIPIAMLATLIVWSLVQQVLGIYLKPWPMGIG